MNNNILSRSLKYFVVVAEHKSFTRAAETLHISQPALSQQIQHLEESLQSMLFDRRTMELTDAGKTYLMHVQKAQAELDGGLRAIHDVKNLKRGFLHLGWTPITDHMTCCLVRDFNKLYPNIIINTLEMPQDEVGAAVIEGRIDAGIIFSDKPSHNIPPDLKSLTLFRESLCLVVGKNHPLAGAQIISIKELTNEPLVLLNKNFALRQHLDKYYLKNHLQPKIVIETNSLNIIIETVEDGKIATILPGSIARQYRLQTINIREQAPEKIIGLVCRERGYQSFACAAFIGLAEKWARRANGKLPAENIKRPANS